MATAISPREIVIDSYRAHGSIRKAARTADVSFGKAHRILKDAGLIDAPEAQPRGGAEPETITRDMGSDGGTVEYSTRRPIVTEADAIAHARIDLTRWRVVRCKITSGEVAMKLRDFDPKGKTASEKPTTVPVWWITLKLEAILPRHERDSLEGLFARLEKPRGAATVAAPRPVEPGSTLCVMDLVDLHFGKLAWSQETGEDYDLKIAERVYLDAVADLLQRSKGHGIGEFLMPLGSDFLHIDNAGGTTTAGTPQDVDGRLAKILETAEMAVVRAVEMMLGRGDVTVRWVPGNHDRLLSYCLARTIAAYFRNRSGITVDVAPTHRKYHRFGRTLIGLTHGNEEKHANLPIIMATERPTDWAETTCREWHVGHEHRSRKLEHLSTDTHGGVPVRVLRSLSAVDAWHHRKGFVGTTRSAEAYLYDQDGYCGHVVANVRGN